MQKYRDDIIGICFVLFVSWLSLASSVSAQVQIGGSQTGIILEPTETETQLEIITATINETVIWENGTDFVNIKSKFPQNIRMNAERNITFDDTSGGVTGCLIFDDLTASFVGSICKVGSGTINFISAVLRLKATTLTIGTGIDANINLNFDTSGTDTTLSWLTSTIPNRWEVTQPFAFGSFGGASAIIFSALANIDASNNITYTDLFGDDLFWTSTNLIQKITGNWHLFGLPRFHYNITINDTIKTKDLNVTNDIWIEGEANIYNSTTSHQNLTVREKLSPKAWTDTNYGNGRAIAVDTYAQWNSIACDATNCSRADYNGSITEFFVFTKISSAGFPCSWNTNLRINDIPNSIFNITQHFETANDYETDPNKLGIIIERNIVNLTKNDLVQIYHDELNGTCSFFAGIKMGGWWNV